MLSRVAILTVLGSVCAAILAVYPIDRTPLRPVEADRPPQVTETDLPTLPAFTPMLEREPLPVAPVQPESPATVEPEWEFPGLAAEEASWARVPFDERERRFRLEARDLDWAPAKEREIADLVYEFKNPPIVLLSVECRTTLCRIAMYYGRNVGMGQLGLRFDRFRELDLDTQGPAGGRDEGVGWQTVLIARRK